MSCICLDERGRTLRAVASPGGEEGAQEGGGFLLKEARVDLWLMMRLRVVEDARALGGAARLWIMSRKVEAVQAGRRNG